MRVCIVCQKEVKSGARVREDPAIRLIRTVKRLLGIARNNELYVCAQDIPAHAQRRKNFEKNLIIASVIGALLVLVLIVLPLLAGRLDVIGLVSALFIGVLIVLAVVFFRYTPAIEQEGSEKKKKRRK